MSLLSPPNSLNMNPCRPTTAAVVWDWDWAEKDVWSFVITEVYSCMPSSFRDFILFYCFFWYLNYLRDSGSKYLDKAPIPNPTPDSRVAGNERASPTRWRLDAKPRQFSSSEESPLSRRRQKVLVLWSLGVEKSLAGRSLKIDIHHSESLARIKLNWTLPQKRGETKTQRNAQTFTKLLLVLQPCASFRASSV